jgi:hypothetical protein
MRARAALVIRLLRAAMCAGLAFALLAAQGFGHGVRAAATPDGVYMVICGADGPYRIAIDLVGHAPADPSSAHHACCIGSCGTALEPPAPPPLAMPAPRTTPGALRRSAAAPAPQTMRGAHGPRAPPL